MPNSSSWVCGQMHFVQTFVFLHLNGSEHSQFSNEINIWSRFDQRKPNMRGNCMPSKEKLLFSLLLKYSGTMSLHQNICGCSKALRMKKSLTRVFQWRVLTCILWSGSSPAVWWWWSVCPCRGEWTSITLRKVQRFATIATPTTSSPSGSTGRYGQGIYLEVNVSLLSCLCLFTVLTLSLSKRLVVCLEESVYIHNIKDMKLLKTLLNTPTNLSGTMRRMSVFKLSELLSFLGVLFIPHLQCHYMLAWSDSWGLDRWETKCSFTCPLCCVAGLCALSVNHSNSYLAYPGSATIGEITLYDANNLVRIQFAVNIQTKIEFQLEWAIFSPAYGVKIVLIQM